MSAKANKQADMRRSKEQTKDGAVANNADFANNNTKAKNKISPNNSSHSNDATNVNGTITGSVRTTGRVKKPKQVYDPSDNYISRGPRSSFTATLPSQASTPSSSQSSSAVPPESSQPSQPPTPPQPLQQPKLENIPIKATELATEAIALESIVIKEEPIDYVPEQNEEERRPLDTCMKCGESEPRRGSGYRSNFLACKYCSMKWHFDCLPMKFEILSNARKRYKCGPCRRCRVCNTKSTDRQTEEQLVMCCACVNVYHLDCHWPRVLSDKIGDMNWKCNSCDHTYNPRETDETTGKLGPQLPPRKSKVGRKKRVPNADSATSTAVGNLDTYAADATTTIAKPYFSSTSDPDSSTDKQQTSDESTVKEGNLSTAPATTKLKRANFGPISNTAKRICVTATIPKKASLNSATVAKKSSSNTATTITMTKKVSSSTATVTKKASTSIDTVPKKSSSSSATTITVKKKVPSSTATTAKVAKKASTSTDTVAKKSSSSSATTITVTKKVPSSTAITAKVAKKASTSTETVAKKSSSSSATTKTVTKRVSLSTSTTAAKKPLSTENKIQPKSADDDDKDYKPPAKIAKLTKTSETAAPSLRMKANENRLPIKLRKIETNKVNQFKAKPAGDNILSAYPPVVLQVPVPTASNSTENKENGTNLRAPQKGMPVSRVGLQVGSWSVDQVYNYAKKYCPTQAELFKQQDIDGSAIMVLTRVDILERFGLKLGQALHVYDMVVRLQTNNDDVTLGWAD